jgi:hypothetical protein
MNAMLLQIHRTSLFYDRFLLIDNPDKSAIVALH